jgi:chromosome segregation ATPase
MPQEMSFAQALNEARQIIVQQSNRIKGDLDRIKAMQETIATQTSTLAETDRIAKQKTTELEATGEQIKALHAKADELDRIAKQKTTELDAANEQIKALTAKMDETRVAKEQADGVIDRQGQRLTQMQETINDLERRLGEHTQKVEHLTRELEGIRATVPTQEDADALAALTSLLSAKKAAPAKSPEETAAAA